MRYLQEVLMRIKMMIKSLHESEESRHGDFGPVPSRSGYYL